MLCYPLEVRREELEEDLEWELYDLDKERYDLYTEYYDKLQELDELQGL